MRPRFRQTFAASVGLSALFLLVYGGCNWITAHRGDVGTFYFEWERAIPFVPFFILPYLSIDLFFVTAPFLCRTDRELRVFARRVAAAILVAGVCFLLFPLRFAFPRPEAGDWTGAIFNWFRGLDAPYNLVPSLHAAFWVFLVPIYARHTRGVLRGAILAWLILIGFSPILTHQHHVIDIIGGFVLAGYCFYFFRESAHKLPVLKNTRMGYYYAAGSLFLFGLGALLWPIGALVLWPAVSLAVVAGGYFGLGPGIFRKSNGVLPWSTRFVLGPCLLGQYLSLLYYRRQGRAWDEVCPNVWIGRRLNKAEAHVAVAAGAAAVLDLSAELSEAQPLRDVPYQNIPILDLTAPTAEQMKQMASFIEQHAQSRIVYVHCKIGYSRSAAAVAAYLITSGRTKNTAEALATIRRVRPSIVIRPEIIIALRDLEGASQNEAASPFLLASEKGGP